MQLPLHTDGNSDTQMNKLKYLQKFSFK